MTAIAARYGFKIDKGLSQTWTATWVTAAAVNIAAGTPTKLVTTDGSIAGTIVQMADGNGLVTGMRFAGIAKDTSTDTAAAAGIAATWYPVPGLLYRGTCKTSTTMTSQAKINALMGARVVFDLDSSTPPVWTVDAAATDALVNCVCIVGGIPSTNECLFTYSSKGSIYNTATSM